MSNSRRNGRQKALKDLTIDLCGKLRATLKSYPNAKFCSQGIYQAEIMVGERTGSENEQWVKKDVLIVNPLEHAWEFFDRYLDLVQEQKVLFVAMNSVRRPPIGIPFYENHTLETLFKGLEINTKFLKYMGSDVIEDSESGRIFWGCMARYFGTNFFRHCFVINYCPLIFTNEERTFNISLSDLDPGDPLVEALVKKCRNAFEEVVKILKPNLIVSIGGYTHEKMLECLPKNYVDGDNLISICQPISITYQQGDISMDEKINEWEYEVNEKLGNNYDWKNVTTTL